MLSGEQYNIDIEIFQQEIRELLVECESLNIKQNELKKKLSLFYNHKINIEAQMDITQRALRETQRDYTYAVDELEDFINCPSCGAEYENSFAERFGIAQDEQRCYELMQELRNQIEQSKQNIDNENALFKQNCHEIAKIEKLLERKQGEVKLRDIIESEGKKEMKNLFENEIVEYKEILSNKLLSKRGYEETLKTFEDKERRKIILSKYLSYMNTFLEKLNVYTLKESSYKRIDSSIKESGSAAPRALMAYYYSILHLMTEYCSSTYFPIIIDSPNQQGQDSENLPNLLKFIVDYQPKNSQLILGLEETHGIDYEGKMLELTEVEHILQADEYDEVYEDIRPLLDVSISFGS